MKKNKKRLAQLALPVIIIGIGLFVAAVIVFVPFSSLRDLHSTRRVAYISECTSGQDFKCYSDYFESKTQTSSALDAITEMKTLATTNEYVKAQCHQLIHVVGRTAYEKYGSLTDAYTKGDSYCWSGYYHGITEAAIGAMGPERIKKDANTVCADLAAKEKYSFDHYNCVHGLGHGFMTVDNFNLFTALKTCDLLVDSWDKDSCYGGVFMENVMVAVREDGTSQYLRPNELMYPCTAVDTPYKNACYLMQTSYALQQTGYDFSKVARLCKTLADTDFVSTCYQSLGRDASGSTSSDLAKTKANCEKATDGAGVKDCMLGAVRDIISYYHSDKQAKEFCSQFEPILSTRCNQELQSYYATFNI